MIVRMRKLSALLYAPDQEAFLQSLRKLGALHLTAKEGEPEEALRILLDKRREIRRVIRALEQVKPADQGNALSPVEIMDRFAGQDKRLNSLEQSLSQARKDRDTLLPWGEFDPETLHKLKAAGVNIRFFEDTVQAFAKRDTTAWPVSVVRRTRNRIWFVLFEKDGETAVPLDEIHPPAYSLAALEKHIQELKTEQEAVGRERAMLAASLPALRKYLDETDGKAEWVHATETLEPCVAGRVLALEGYFPAAREKEFAAFLDRSGAWFTVRDPEPGDPVPIKLRNSPFARLFEPITKIFALPGYTEIDPTPFFAPFFTLFVGLCLGDVGYGLVLMILASIAYFRLKPSVRPVALLVLVIGASAALCGVLLNSFFCHNLFGGPGIPEGSAFISKGAEWAPLAPRNSSQGTVFPAMTFAMFVGVVQVLLGMVLCAVNRISQGGLLFGLQPVGFFLMVVGGLSWGAHADFMGLGLGQLVIGPVEAGRLLLALPVTVSKVLTFAGILMHFLFNNPDKKIITRLFDPTKGLLEFYFFVSGFMGNVLSYLRLFALGLSSGLLGNAFTYIAFMFITTADGKADYSSPLIVLTVLVLLVGHSLNLALSMIGSFVHPLRLTFVEFYSNLGFKGGGVPYTPFGQNRETAKTQLS